MAGYPRDIVSIEQALRSIIKDLKEDKIKEVAKGMAEIAFSMGETNDPEEYAERMTEDILEALKDVHDRQSGGKKKKKSP